ncbi:hypothetical protein T484DRAFT_1804019 [Baffinella frigidus]|nr:hypothetical protein T484DRAFT_1804019 [Cryptophyta sp. CCMP2293]
MCGRCQLQGWAKHKGSCVTPEDRVARVIKAVNAEIPEAQARWDSATVIKLGLRTVEDFARCVWTSSSRADSLTIDLHDQLGRAHSRSGFFGEAAHHYEQASFACARTEEFARQGLLLANKADMQYAGGEFEAAMGTFAQVEHLGEKGGYFDLYSRACIGRARCARKSGDKDGAMVMAQESLKAASLMLDGQFGQQRMEAAALLVVCNLSDMYAVTFDDSLLNRLLKLSEAVEQDAREGGTTMHIYALELVGRRHLAMGRSKVGAAAYRRVLRLAADKRFSGMEDIANTVKAVKEMLENVDFFGLG